MFMTFLPTVYGIIVMSSYSKTDVLASGFIFFLILFLCLIFGLVLTAKQGRWYWAQVGSGTLLSLISRFKPTDFWAVSFEQLIVLLDGYGI
jgi:hypothetical protein